MSRTKGIPGAGDVSGYAQAESIRLRGVENRARGALALGEGVGSGLLRLGAGIKDERERSAARTERDRKNRLEERRLGLAEDRETWDRGMDVARFSQGQYEFESRKQRDAENALLEYESKAMSAGGSLQALQQAATADPTILDDPLFQGEYQSAQASASRHAAHLKALRERVGQRSPMAPASPAPTPQAVEGRVRTADEMIQEGEAVEAQGAKAGSFALRLRGARMKARGVAEKDRAAREIKRQESDSETAKSRAQWGANFDAFMPIVQQEQYAGVGRDVKAALAQQVMSGGLTIPQATAELQRAAGFTSEAGAMRGEARGAGKVAEAGSTGTRTPEQEQARQDAERVARGEERQTAKSERDVKAALRAFTNEADNRDFFGDPVPPRLELLSSEDAHTVLSSPEASPGVRDLARRVLESRGEPVGAVPSPGPAVERPPAGVGGAREAAAREMKALPAEQQTPEAWAAIKRKHGL